MIKEITKSERKYFSLPNQPQLVMKCDPMCFSLFRDIREKKHQDVPHANNTHYCSQECQKLDWKMHKNECKFLQNMRNNLPCNILMTLRLFCNNMDVDLFYGNLDTLNEEQLLQFQEVSAYIANYTDSKSLPSLEKLLKYQVKQQYNLFTITDNLGNTQLGVGLYTPANFLDHKCNKNGPYENIANCSHFYMGRSLMMITNDSFKQGDELNICYTEIFNYKERQKFLKDQYGFDCDCGRCEYERTTQENLVPQEIDLIKCDFKDFSIFKNYYYYQKLLDYYLKLLDQQKFKRAFKVIQCIVHNLPTYYNNKNHPQIGWSSNEAAKLAFHLNNLLKAEYYGKQAYKILKTYFENTIEFKEVEVRMKDIEAEIKMNK
ncbi:hypothetical protein pb186bvf_003550 [Paramecium bursaria]